MISPEQKSIFDENGYVLIRQLFQPDEVSFYRDHYMRLREKGSYPGDLVSQGADPRHERSPPTLSAHDPHAPLG